MAVLGSKPQLVTLTLDCLKQQGSYPEETIVFHTCRERPETCQALEQLETYQAEALTHIQYVEMQGDGSPLSDITSLEQLQAGFRCLYTHVRKAKIAEKSVHLQGAGGRSTMTLFGMAVAQMLFDDTDRLWYLVSHPDLEASGALQPGPGEWARLIPIPVIPWGRLSPAFNVLYSVEDPLAAAESLRRLRMREQWDLARIFVLTSLSTAERLVAELLVRDGLTQAEIAKHLSISPRTVEQHLRSAYDKAAAHWELNRVNQSQLVRLLSIYFPAEFPK